MWYRDMFQRGLYRDAAAAPAGSTTASDPAAAGAGGGGASGMGAPPSSSPNGSTGAAAGAFDWGKVGLDPEALVLVNDRQWKGPADLITSYRHLERLQGVPPDRLLKLPTDKDPADSWTQVWDRLGRPKDAAEYKIPLPEGDPGDFAKVMAPIFHKANLTQTQVQTLATEYNTMLAAQHKEQTAAAKLKHDAEMTALTQEWGPRAKEFNDVVDRTAEAFGMTKSQLLGLQQAMGPAAAMKFLLNIGSKIAVEGAFHAGDQNTGFNAMTPAMAEAKIQELRRNRDFAERYNSTNVEVRSKAREEMERLHTIAYPPVAAGNEFNR